MRQQRFETAIIERYRRRESSVEEALVKMYLAGVSVRRVEDITEALWGTKVSPGTVAESAINSTFPSQHFAKARLEVIPLEYAKRMTFSKILGS